MKLERHNHLRYTLSLGATLGLAATLPVHADNAATAWSGWSVGMTLGSAKTKADVKFDLPSNYIGTAGSAPQVDAASLSSQIAPSSLSDRNLCGEFQVGYNRQSGNFVWGGSAGLVLNGMKAEHLVAGASTSGPAWTAQIETSVKSAAMLTVRPRVGYALGKGLIYATGGLALARLKVNQSHHQLYLGGPAGGYGLEVSDTKTKLGWTAGCGADYALSPRWTLRGELLFTRLGKVSTDTMTTDEGNWTSYPVAGEKFHHEFKVKSQSLNLGVSYKF